MADMEYLKNWRPQLTFHMLFLETFHCWMNLFARSTEGDLGDVYHNRDNLSKSTPHTLFGFHFSLGLLLVFSSGIGDKVFFCFRKLLSLVVEPTDVLVNFDFPRKLLSNEFSLSRFFLHTHLPDFSSKVAIWFLSSFII